MPLLSTTTDASARDINDFGTLRNLRTIDITVSAILSDMDGTLVDSTPAVEGALSKWARSQGVEPEEFFAVSHGVRTR